MPEIWKPVPGFDGYEVSSMGRVRSFRKGALNYLKAAINGNGYFHVVLRKNGGSYVRRVHQLVLIAFKGTRPRGKECAHLDSNKINNRLDNLQWVTRSQNQKMRAAQFPESYAHTRKRLTPKIAGQIKTLLALNLFSQYTIANYFGISNTTVSKIKNRRHSVDIPLVDCPDIIQKLKMYSNNIRSGRSYKNQCLSRLAEAALVSCSSISAIVRGKSNPSWETAKKLAKTTGTRPEQWLDGTASERKAMAFKYLGAKR